MGVLYLVILMMDLRLKLIVVALTELEMRVPCFIHLHGGLQRRLDIHDSLPIRFQKKAEQVLGGQDGY